jgi:hypothetical protein
MALRLAGLVSLLVVPTAPPRLALQVLQMESLQLRLARQMLQLESLRLRLARQVLQLESLALMALRLPRLESLLVPTALAPRLARQVLQLKSLPLRLAPARQVLESMTARLARQVLQLKSLALMALMALRLPRLESLLVPTAAAHGLGRQVLQMGLVPLPLRLHQARLAPPRPLYPSAYLQEPYRKLSLLAPREANPDPDGYLRKVFLGCRDNGLRMLQLCPQRAR